MKRIIFSLICVCLILCGCKAEPATSVKQPVKIVMPTDNSVNGYRTSSADNNSMPDKIDGNEVSPNAEISNNNTSPNVSYCGNKNTKKFHKSTCSASKKTKDENKVYFNTKEEFLESGYTACKICKP